MSKPLAILYFTRDKTEIAMDLAARVRNEGNLVNMVFAGGFKRPDQCIKCDAVIIQNSFGRAAEIADTYRQQFPEAEIHLYNDNGEFDDEAFAAPPADPSTEEEDSTPEASGEDTAEPAESEESNDVGEEPTVTE